MQVSVDAQDTSSEENQGSTVSAACTNSAPFEILSKPSRIIKHYQSRLISDGASYQLNLITMKRSFLLVISNVDPADDAPSTDYKLDGNQIEVSEDAVIRGFMDSNSSMLGLSLAIGEHSTCLIESDNSLASVTLAQRLSKKLNLNRPVYVANNLKAPHDTLDMSGSMARLYLKIFHFVKSNYNPETCRDDQ